MITADVCPRRTAETRPSLRSLEQDGKKKESPEILHFLRFGTTQAAETRNRPAAVRGHVTQGSCDFSVQKKEKEKETQCTDCRAQT